ncbi:recombinase family protein [Muricauda sp. SCSIO 64092]|uniref:recombinase family protein n=1 Tax=Allomuricauda sp. SCSIO 64092 TaxID=2908842 RepID=UPI001FF248A3|nr:recombinase family protein [Muricauda sp. SCSIO 64092]UOY04996.1 recombinase family protein [Muricauda sp. SCSIO 64092]
MNEYDPNNPIYDFHFKYGAYTRKSSEAEERQIQSIERQNDDLIEIIEKHDLDVYGEIIEETKSAFYRGREKFDELVALTEKGVVNAWLCWHPNRLSRNAVDSGIIIDLMDRGKLHHIRTPSRTYFNTPSDKLFLQVELILSKKDSDDKSVFVKSGLKKRYKKGLPTGKTPIGFLNDKTKEKGDRGWLVDKDRLKKVGYILARFLKGRDSITTITDYARNELKLTTVPLKNIGGKLISRSMMELLLKNPIYAGFFYSKDETTEGRTERVLDESLPRLITVEQHKKILQILSKRSYQKVQEHEATYNHIIVGEDNQRIGADFKFQLICDCKHKFAYRARDRCPKCNLLISQMKNPTYLSYTYYYNIQRRKTKETKAKCIEEKRVNEYLADYIRNNFSLSEDLCNWGKKHIAELRDKSIQEHSERKKTYTKELQRLAEEKSELRKMYLRKLISEEEFISDNKEINMKEEEIRTKNGAFENYFEELESLFNLSVEFEDIILNGSLEEKKRVLQEFGSNLLWNEEKLEIIRSKWLTVFEKSRKHILAKNRQFEPEKSVEKKGSNADLRPLCPVLLSYLDELRTYLMQVKNKCSPQGKSSTS